MSEKIKVSEVIKDGVRITTYDNGTQFFETIEDNNEKQEEVGFWDKVKNWLKKYEVKPYVKVRDMADPFGDRRNDPDDMDVGRDGKNGCEIGIKMKF